jgi:plastocyanin
MKFSPVNIVVKPGQTVIWKNTDLVPHTVTSLKPNFDSKTIDPGKSWTFQPAKKGRFAYRCIFHPGMTGTLVVK